MPAMPPLKRQATPVELAALLMDAACRSSDAEESALRKLAEFFKLDLHGMLDELMFLRAFTVDFAIAITLGDGPEKEQILARSQWPEPSEEAHRLEEENAILEKLGLPLFVKPVQAGFTSGEQGGCLGQQAAGIGLGHEGLHVTPPHGGMHDFRSAGLQG